MRLTVLICTHNRSALLRRVLASICEARRPPGIAVELLVVANACTDDTAEVLRRYEAESRRNSALPLRWTVEPTPGKSHALNCALPMISDGLVAFVDDDHRIDREYLASLAVAAAEYTEASLFCGRILPDWDGREPAWVHDAGVYRIYPLPVPRYDQGDEPREITADGRAPGGGNLCVRREVFDRVGAFSTNLGPHGHDLGGGEDADFVYRCLAAGERIQYVPAVLQYHYVDPERLRIGYLLRKSFQRSRSWVRAAGRHRESVPLYVWRKVATYFALSVASLSWPRRRFFLVRLAAALGEWRGFLDNSRDHDPPKLVASVGLDGRRIARQSAVLIGLAAIAAIASSERVAAATFAVFWAALGCTVVLLMKSFYDFSQTGPPLRREILRQYRTYSMLALVRLGFWAFALCAAMAAGGVLLYAAATCVEGTPIRFWPAIAAAAGGIVGLTTLQFCRHLLYLPASIAASFHYRASRLYALWRQLTPAGLRAGQWVLSVAAITLFTASAWRLALLGEKMPAAGFLLLALAGPLGVLGLRPDPGSDPRARRSAKRPNILMIGSDTLRADRFVAGQYPRTVAPFIESFARTGTLFSACYVPCARTAPSLISMLTGTWPHRHGIRDNFVGDEETQLTVPALATILARDGYRTAAVSDWCGADLGKFPLGFEVLDLPKDQWNVKYLIRQGPKDLRLLLSLFTHNRFGKLFLPELYYLAGVPLTSLVGRDARALISQFAAQDAPFFLNVFMSTTHPPFGSEYPYYTLWSTPDYSGESKFVMARLTDPWEVIRRQGDSKTEFDLEQIVDLYDGCVRNFDDEVRRIVEHVRACGLAENTVIVIYSDHGMEFFEHDTWGQGNSVRTDASARVPLIIVDPRRGSTGPCSHIVRSIDVAPTLLELAGVAAPKSMDGVSLAPYLKESGVDLDLPAFNETGIWLTDLPGMPAAHLRYPNLLELLEVPNTATGTLAIKRKYRQAVVEAKDRMVRRGPWKLTRQPTIAGPRYALFNVELDPDCQQDVAQAHPHIARELAGLLERWIAGRDERQARESTAESPHKRIASDS